MLLAIDPSAQQQLPARRLSRNERRALAIKTRVEAEEARASDRAARLSAPRVYEVTEHTDINFLLINLQLKHSVLNTGLGIGKDQYTINLKDNETLRLTNMTPDDVIDQLITAMMNMTVTANNLRPTDFMQFRLEAEPMRGHMWSDRITRIKDLTATLITQRLSAVLQSSEKLEISGMKMGFVFIRMPEGGSSGRSFVTKLSDYDCKKGYKTIVNDDDLCFARALYVCLQKLALDVGDLKLSTYQKRLEMRSPKPILGMLKEVGVQPGRVEASVEAISPFEKHFNVTINIISLNCDNACIYPISTSEQHPTQVYLHLTNNHCNAILNINSVLVVPTDKAFCNGCKSIQSLKHKCKSLSNLSNCHLCQKSHEHDLNEEIMCLKCNRTFTNQTCFDNHLPTICDKIFICVKCDKYITLDGNIKEHHCGYTWCRNCSWEKPIEHNCFIRTLKAPADEDFKQAKLIFYDYECYVDENGVHIPNIIVARRCNEHRWVT